MKIYEVELKFPLSETESIVAQLRQLGVVEGDAISQRDRYFGHPSRNFAETDEALRIRTVCAPHGVKNNCVTYKGPIVDSQVKTRHEIEISFGTEEADGERFAALLNCLGFREVRSVSKSRVPFQLQWEDRRLEIALDRVEGLGTYLEFETLAEEETKNEARDCILKFAEILGLENSERKSYLQLLLEHDTRESSLGL